MPEEFTFAEESTGPEWVTTLMFNTLPFEVNLSAMTGKISEFF